MCKLLLDNGADPNLPAEKPPHFALALCTDNRIATSILVAGVDLNKCGKAVLEHAKCWEAILAFSNDWRRLDREMRELTGKSKERLRMGKRLSRLTGLQRAARLDIPELALYFLDKEDPFTQNPSPQMLSKAPRTETYRILQRARLPW